jgi:multiple sugar transport system permease protein
MAKIRRGFLGGYLYLLPLLIGVALLSVYPAVYLLWMSVNKIQLANIRRADFVGLRNYLDLFRTANPTFGHVLSLSVVFVFFSVVFHVAIGFTLANILSTRWVRGKLAWRNLFLISWVAASIVVGYTFRFMFDTRAGMLNALLRLVNVPPQAWTADPSLAFPAIIAVNIWRGVPFSLIIETAGLQSINTELYDAAYVDGASGFQILTRIKIPLVKEFILLDAILDTAETFQVFETVLALTGGGPVHRTEVLALYMYNEAFKYGDLGAGSAVAVMLLLISVIVAVLYLRFFRPQREAV